jgi:hypothetical protein
MNAERLHAIAGAVQKDLSNTDTRNNLAAIVDSLGRVVANPSDQGFAASVV